MFKWKKLGNVFNPQTLDTEEWMQEYAQLPFPYLIDENSVILNGEIIIWRIKHNG